MGPKDDSLLVSLRLDPFNDTTSGIFTLNAISKTDFCMILRSKVGFLPLFIAKIVANQYCTDTSVQTANLEAG